MGILFTFIFQVTFFVACLTLDTKRIDARRDGMFFCLQYSETWKPNAFSQKNILQDFFAKLGAFLKKKLVKGVVILMALLLTSLGAYGSLQIQIEFDFLKFLPEESTLFQWYHTNHQFFPEEGFRGNIYFAESDLNLMLPKLRNLTRNMKKNADRYLVNFDPWYPGFEEYLLNYYVESIEDIDSMDADLFNEKLTQYLYSPSGGKYRHLFNFKNDSNLECGQSAPHVAVRAVFTPF